MMVDVPDFVKRLFHARHIFEAVKPLFLITYMFGMTPFYLVKDHNKQYILKTSNVGYFLTCAAFALMCSIFARALLVNESIIAYFFRSDITMFADTIQNLFEMSGAVVLYISTTRGKYHMLYMMRAIDEADSVIKGLGGIQILHRSVLYFVWILTGIVFFVVIGYTLMNYFVLSNAQIYPTTNFFITFTLLNAVITILIGHFICMTRVIQRRFQILFLVSVFVV